MLDLLTISSAYLDPRRDGQTDDSRLEIKNDQQHHLMPELPNRITLRSALPTDEPFLFDLFVQTRGGELGAWGDNTQLQSLLTIQYHSQRGAYTTRFPDAEHKIIMFDDELVGQLVVDHSTGKIVLVDISILPERQNKGIGSIILEDLCRLADEQQASIELKVAIINPARRLYEQLGFCGRGSDGMYEQMERKPWTGGPETPI